MISISKKHFKVTAYFLLCDLLLGLFFPTFNAVYALTSGPSSPEFSSFEPVATTNLVDPLTGDFTYNLPVIQIPGPDGSGYAMSLSYHSGTSSEEESSWVGHGWTLNPGAINASVRGIPDEYNETPVDYYNKARPNWTMTGLRKANLEIFSKSGNSVLGISIDSHIRYNNYQGFAKTSSLGLAKGGVSLSMHRSPTGVTYSAAINPFSLFKKKISSTVTLMEKFKKEDPDEKEKTEKQDKKTTFKATLSGSGGTTYDVASLFGLQTFTDVGQSVSLTKMTGINANLSYGLQVNPVQAPIGIEGGLTGSFSISAPVSKETLTTSGYLGSSSSARSDYFTEKSQPFDRRDFFLGIPFSSPDNYSLTGEGLSGGFRAFADGPRAFSNNDGAKNKISTYGIGLELMFGVNVGVGVNLSFGNNSSKMSWLQNLGNSNGPDNIKYRFYGDLGGKVNFANNDIANVSLTAKPNFPGITQVKNNVNDDKAFHDKTINSAMNSSSYINKIKEGGFDIYSNTGLKYSYSEPVLVRNSANLTFGIDKNDEIEDNYLAYTPTHLGSDYNVDLGKHKLVNGEVRKEPYENTSLLKSITTPDYIDLGVVGLDDGDFGGWTSFEYHKKYGKNSEKGEWYRWRMPYTGLIYNKNSISDAKDDTGSVSTGEKEVNYLKKVETKTHVAYFVTNLSDATRFGVSGAGAKYLKGSGVTRFDGLGSPTITTEDASSRLKDAKGTGKDLEYLEKIVLFSKARPDLPLQVTNFQYDYSLVKNLPNNSNGNYPGNRISNNSGKLTLKKVWSEFEGVVDARISSYKFGYQYTAHHQTAVNYSLSAQNPDYGPYLLDPWGNNQFDVKGNVNSAANRHLNMINWPYQGNFPKEDFDPAAWQLKQIVLPSGGQILIEYESKDYQYVQDREVMAMVRLSSIGGSSENPTYTLDLSDVGGYSEELCEKIKKYFTEGKPDSDDPDQVRQRIYFKMLYGLNGSLPNLNGCMSEYITGYAKIKTIECDGKSISITLNGKGDENSIGEGYRDNPEVDPNYQLTPSQACSDFNLTQRWGKYTDGCEGEFERLYEQNIIDNLITSEGDVKSNNLKSVINALKYSQGGIEKLAFMDKKKLNQPTCGGLAPQLSYLKIPMGKAKRGGGIRVKKILMYDKGIESGDEATYGQSYRYELEDGRSSGVASNEPQEMREENPLVSFLPKKDQSWINRLIAGQDKEQSEGPIGESLLPSASVVHSRVVVENIHNGKTGTGYTIHEFYTSKDYPFDKLYDYQVSSQNGDRQFDFATERTERGVDYSVLQDNMYNDKLSLPTSYFRYDFDKSWASQGFRFIQNGMSGSPKSVRTYGGTYASGNRSYISSGQDYFYYEPGEKVRLFTEFNGNNIGKYIWDVPGKEMDVTQEGSRVEVRDLDFNFEIDVSAGLSLPPPIFVSFSVVFSYNEQFLTKYATSKIIKYPVIQKKIVSYADNIATTTENLAFDYATGTPILTKTYDAYHGIQLSNSDKIHDGSVYNLNIPAHYNYAGMGQKSRKGTNTNQLTSSSGQIVSYGANANPVNPDGTWSIKSDRVISAGASTYNILTNVSSWIDESITEEYKSNGSESVYRMHENYAFKGVVKKSSDRNTETGKIFNGGVIEGFIPFDYKANTQDQKWVKLTEITKYSPNGSVLEEKDVLGVYSAAKYGYNFTLPTMIGKNSTYNEMYFEYFEDKKAVESNLVMGDAHSGIYSKQIVSGESILKNVKAGQLLFNTGGWLKFWTKSDIKLSNASVEVNGKVFIPEFIAKTGAWTLYKVFVTPEVFVLGDNVVANLNFDNSEAVFIDDIKFTPKEAQTTCYVYDVKSLRLLAMFDDQHFGLYYQYNGEGQLVRKLIETERGLKLITETQYNLPKEYREKK